MQWHTRTGAESLAELRVSERGLSKDTVTLRRKEYGENTLPKARRRSLASIFISQFQSPIIYILLISAIIVWFLGEFIDSAIIFAVLVINAVIGVFQEGRAESALAALKHYVETSAIVLRDGKEESILDRELVPGDIIVLREGDRVPADARVLYADALTIEEAALTGESEPVEKNSDPIADEKLPIADQRNMVFRGTYVVRGSGKAVVTATGGATVIGGISKKLELVNTDMPLKAHIESLSRMIIVVVVVACIAVFAIGLMRGIGIREMFTVAVATAVSIIPEGLPVVVTLVLATGVRRMSKRNALVKRLQAVEALGQAKVIAVDKTGTVTLNQMMVTSLFVDDVLYEVTGEGYEPKGLITREGASVESLDHPGILLSGKIAALTAFASIVHDEEKKEWRRISGDPTEAALLVFSEKIGFHKDELEHENPQRIDIPFSYQTKYHASVNETEGGAVLSVAGAPEAILPLCERVWKAGRPIPLRAEEKGAVYAMLHTLSSQGLRVLALAANFRPGKAVSADSLPSLCFVGFVGIRDAIRPEVHEAVKYAQKAGVRVVMITGDHVETAQAIALNTGIMKEGDRVITGVELGEMDDATLRQVLPSVSVFARVTPEHKLSIVEAYQKLGIVIAMTGDGVNDALSLAAADLGVAMGKIGTEVAKGASDIVLLDDNFGSIVAAIEEGRNIYLTIKKVILYLFSTSLGELLTISGALILGLPIPIIASQILWLNFVTDTFMVAALAMEPMERAALGKRAAGRLINEDMIERVVAMGLTMTVGTLIVFSLFLDAGYVKASTMALTVLAVYQWFNAWNCRSSNTSVFAMNPFSNLYLVGSLLVVIGCQIMAVYLPFFQRILNTTPLTLNEWLIAIGVGFSIILVDEVRKLAYRLALRRRQK